MCAICRQGETQPGAADADADADADARPSAPVRDDLSAPTSRLAVA